MSLEKNVSLSMLLDFYGEMLTPKQRETVDMYCNDDLSLSEIAEITGLTRPGVRDRIVKSEAALRSFEEKLGLLARFADVQNEIASITESLEALRDGKNADIDSIIERMKLLQKKEGA